MLKRWLKDERGATAIEYGLIAVFISVAAVTAIATTGTGTNGLYGRIATAFNTYMP